jgi:hypothetical protein
MSISDHLEFKHLKAVIAIAEEGTFTAAAARLHLAQSALSRQICDLEEDLKIQVFERDRTGATPTPGGETLIQYARDALQAREDTVKAVRAIQQAGIRPFRLGFHQPAKSAEMIAAELSNQLASPSSSCLALYQMPIRQGIPNCCGRADGVALPREVSVFGVTENLIIMAIGATCRLNRLSTYAKSLVPYRQCSAAKTSRAPTPLVRSSADTAICSKALAR